MKLEAPKLRQTGLQSQEVWRRARAEAPRLRQEFPAVERLQIVLRFVNMTSCASADQTHTMHPAAQAFFSFPCPYADCDGRFELHGVIAEALTRSAHDCEGELRCSGHRLRDGDNGLACGLTVHYAVAAFYQQPSTLTTRATAPAEGCGRS
jgi:hypothetical protein